MGRGMGLVMELTAGVDGLEGVSKRQWLRRRVLRERKVRRAWCNLNGG